MFHADAANPPNSFSHSQISANGIEYLQPQVPMMIANLNTFIHDTNPIARTQVGRTYRATDLAPAAHADVTIFGQTFRDNTATRNDFKPMLQACGISSPFVFGNSNYPEAADFARETDFGHSVKLVIDDTNTQGLNLVTSHLHKDLETFLFMQKGTRGTSNLKWFEYLRQQAVIHARFFDQVYHFSDVNVVIGLETTNLCKLKIEGDTPEDCFYHDLRMGLGQAASWYHRPLTGLIAGFATNRSGVKRNEELQSFTYGTNATLPIIVRAAAATAITDADAPVCSLTQNDGAFWTNKEWIKQLNFRNRLIEGKPMYTGVNSTALRCIRDKPHGTGIVDNNF